MVSFEEVEYKVPQLALRTRSFLAAFAVQQEGTTPLHIINVPYGPKGREDVKDYLLSPRLIGPKTHHQRKDRNQQALS